MWPMTSVRTRPRPTRLVRALDWRLEPGSVVGAWPDHAALAALWSGAGPSRSRWTILAMPTGSVVGRVEGGAIGLDWRGVRAGTGEGLDGLFDAMARGAGHAVRRKPDSPPFVGGWIGWLGYGVGAAIEPAARHAARARDDRGWPDLVWHQCPGAYIHDRETGRWWAAGTERGVRELPLGIGAEPGPGRAKEFEIGAMASETGRARYEESVRRGLEYIRAGDVFQVNLTHRLTGSFRGSARACFVDLMARSEAWYGAYVEEEGPDERRIMASASPELFLEFDARSRRVVTRPMKGTRPIGADPRDLAESEKDRAELNMIIDLMRNDLGRVCRFGSVRVDEARVIEPHGRGGGALLQGVATVSGVLREGVGLGELVRAAFPAGSVTGAPKIRAMQIIEELEVGARGPYCGAVGYVSDCGNAALSVAIRTALIGGRKGLALDGIEGGRLDYSVGAGIVADSDPGSEWRETLDKAGTLGEAGEP